ncbi:MAG: DUF4111 domain-containing protein [Anaerolineales bacterium]|nr:DUF4111 domain-containing protein [Anaerolineales bacterium]
MSGLMSEVTPYPEANQMLTLLQERILAILGPRLVGLYLYGSLVWGDCDLGVSDIDLLAVTAGALTQPELDALRQLHAQLAAAYPLWDDHIEVAYVSTTALKTFRTEASQFANISPGEPFHVLDVSRHWLLNWYVVQERGLALYGRPPRAVIDHIAVAEYQAVVRDHLAGWGEWVEEMQTRKQQAYTILTLCRAMAALETGEQLSKRQAALWAAQQAPEWADTILTALDWRTGDEETGALAAASMARTVDFVAYVREREGIIA